MTSYKHHVVHYTHPKNGIRNPGLKNIEVTQKILIILKYPYTKSITFAFILILYTFVEFTIYLNNSTTFPNIPTKDYLVPS